MDKHLLFSPPDRKLLESKYTTGLIFISQGMIKLFLTDWRHLQFFEWIKMAMPWSIQTSNIQKVDIYKTRGITFPGLEELKQCKEINIKRSKNY